MKYLLVLIAFFSVVVFSFGQEVEKPVQNRTYRFVKTDGGELIGSIISQDDREIYILTKDGRSIYVPQHEIKEILPMRRSKSSDADEESEEDRFSTRYFLTTNGLPIKKGDHYIQWNLYGPDIHFGVSDNLGVGITTSWLGIPIIGSIKRSWELGPKTQFAVGGLLGTGSWIAYDWGGALPFATLSYGDRRNNIAVSGGYGAIWQEGESSGRGLASVAGMTRLSSKLSFVFDSYILLPGGQLGDDSDVWALLIPGIRWHQREGKAFQVGFAGVISSEGTYPIPLPMLQWYRTL